MILDDLSVYADWLEDQEKDTFLLRDTIGDFDISLHVFSDMNAIRSMEGLGTVEPKSREIYRKLLNKSCSKFKFILKNESILYIINICYWLNDTTRKAIPKLHDSAL